MRLRNKIALITAAASGMGRAGALRFRAGGRSGGGSGQGRRQGRRGSTRDRSGWRSCHRRATPTCPRTLTRSLS